MLTRAPIVVTSVAPHEGREGTIVTLRGHGFAPHARNNCVVVAGMGACARAEPGSSDTELKVRIGPVARKTSGQILMWPGVAAELFPEVIRYGDTRLAFTESALFRNGAPVTNAGVEFTLTDVSPGTYAGTFENASATNLELGGLEGGAAMCVRLPRNTSFGAHATVDLCLVLKEPTLAIDFTAGASGGNAEATLRAIAKSINVHALLIGEAVFADVVSTDSGELELYVTKPYLSNGMVTLHFSEGARYRE